MRRHTRNRLMPWPVEARTDLMVLGFPVESWVCQDGCPLIAGPRYTTSDPMDSASAHRRERAAVGDAAIRHALTLGHRVVMTRRFVFRSVPDA